MKKNVVFIATSLILSIIVWGATNRMVQVQPIQKEQNSEKIQVKDLDGLWKGFQDTTSDVLKSEYLIITDGFLLRSDDPNGVGDENTLMQCAVVGGEYQATLRSKLDGAVETTWSISLKEDTLSMVKNCADMAMGGQGPFPLPSKEIWIRVERS